MEVLVIEICLQVIMELWACPWKEMPAESPPSSRLPRGKVGFEAVHGALLLDVPLTVSRVMEFRT